MKSPQRTIQKKSRKTSRKTSRKSPWKTLSKREIYENPWIVVTERDVINPAGKKSLYGVVHFQNLAVGVLALDDQDRLLLVGQYRYPLSEYSWEIPEGGCPGKFKPLAAAKRELKEETGYTAERWSRILELTLSNSVTDERAIIFRAQGLTSGKSEPEETEELKVKWVKFSQAIRMVKRGKITDAISVAAILYEAAARC